MFLVRLRQAGPEFDHSRPLEQQSGWEEHAAFMDGLVADGHIVLGEARLLADLQLRVVLRPHPAQNDVEHGHGYNSYTNIRGRPGFDVVDPSG